MLQRSLGNTVFSFLASIIWESQLEEGCWTGIRETSTQYQPHVETEFDLVEEATNHLLPVLLILHFMLPKSSPHSLTLYVCVCALTFTKSVLNSFLNFTGWKMVTCSCVCVLFCFPSHRDTNALVLSYLHNKKLCLRNRQIDTFMCFS